MPMKSKIRLHAAEPMEHREPIETIGAKESGESQSESTAENLSQTCVTPEERHELISQAAYFRAEHRGFAPGSEQQDWFEAQNEIDEMLGPSGAESQ